MNARLVAVVLACGATFSTAHAQVVTMTTRGQPVRAIARLASQGLGYSVVYQDVGALAPSYRVKVVCTFGQLSAMAQCPSLSHDAYCPTAQIVCR